MAQYVNGRDVAPRIKTRMTLEQVEKAALVDGCTAAQFKYATEAAGHDPEYVIAFLIRRSFVSKAFQSILTAGENVTRN